MTSDKLIIRTFAVLGDSRSTRAATILRHLSSVDFRPGGVLPTVDAVLLLDNPSQLRLEIDDLTVPVINLHAAPLPGYRGECATYWALYHDEPLEVCAHLVARGVENGPILGRRRLPVRTGDNLEAIDRRGYEVCGELAAQVIQDAKCHGIAIAPQEAWQGRTFRGPMPQDIIDECQRRLQAGEYSHFS